MRKALLALGALIAIGAVAGGAALIVDSIERFSEARIEDSRTVLPGVRDAELDAGKHVLYYEVDADSVVTSGDEVVGDIPVPPLEVTIRRDADGPPLPLRDYGGSFELTGGGRAATAVRTVRVPEDGSYRIRARGRPGTAVEPAVVLGRPVGGRVLRLVLGIALAVLGFALAALVTVLAVVLWLRARRAAPT